tara:strand:+ start:66 stop:935 length:870 start_codon:yes stop_codon:yes gene_type:complete
MSVVVGQGDYRYELVENWAKLPEGWIFTQVGAVAVDQHDEVYVFNRSEHPVIVFDKEGNFIRSFGEGSFPSAHGMCWGENESVWLVDSIDHTVKKYSKSGNHILTIGNENSPGEDGEPFNKPTDASVASNGDLYISDGYGNTKVHVFSQDGTFKFSWGQEKGPAVWDGDFNTPHNIWVHDQTVYVADRENHRVQLFDLKGNHKDTWTDFIQPTDIYINPNDPNIVYVAELRNRVSIVNQKGQVLSRWGRYMTNEPGMFYAAHGIWTDSEKSVYIGEVLEGQRIQKFKRI